MKCRDVYLRIEPVPAYSPVAPTGGEHGAYGRDCMRNHGHEDAHIPDAEVLRRQVDALVYRQYTDATYSTPVTDPLVPADLTEPVWDRRIPATVLWTEPGERLRVHVLNADTAPHSLHVHGLAYGIDSDGSWPFGVAAVDGRRSDAICPGEQWCYTFDITPDTVGAWPFHDHVQNIEASADRGLFGGIICGTPTSPKPDLEVPFFLHRMVGSGGDPLFDSGQLAGGDTFAHPFPAAATFDYVCRLHPMTGTVPGSPRRRGLRGGGHRRRTYSRVRSCRRHRWVLAEPSPEPTPGPCRTRSARPRPRPWTRSRSTGARCWQHPDRTRPSPCGHVGGGSWERLPDLDQFLVHAALLHTGRVLLWSGTAEVGDSFVWDPATDARTRQTYGDDTSAP